MPGKTHSFAGLLCAVIAICGLAPAIAWTPAVKTQPGFYRVMVGDFEVTALNDCVIPYPVTTMLNATPEQIKNGLAESHVSDPVGMSYNAFLVNTGSKLVLIDTGTGGKLADNAGFRGCSRVMANLRAAGYKPEQVEEIYISHNGPDHIGGLTIGSERAFPNALVRASKDEVDRFLDPAKVAAAIAAAPNKEQAKQGFDFIGGLYQPYVKAGKFQTFDADITLVPGIKALATHGHTQGHTSYVLESKGQRMIVLGDLVHWGSVQFPYPSVYTAFDADPKAATAQRLRVFQMAADEDDWVAGAHLSFPAIGHIRAGEGRYYWIPSNYAIPE
jgi:glyoxylase-like metal-dependent hydrolase (beta-lactamase superfamily II)